MVLHSPLLGTYVHSFQKRRYSETYRENSYWVGLMSYTVDQMKTSLADIAATGATVVRTWSVSQYLFSTQKLTLCYQGIQRADEPTGYLLPIMGRQHAHDQHWRDWSSELRSVFTVGIV